MILSDEENNQCMTLPDDDQKYDELPDDQHDIMSSNVTLNNHENYSNNCASHQRLLG